MSASFVLQVGNGAPSKPRSRAVTLVKLAAAFSNHAGRVRHRYPNRRFGDPVTRREALKWAAWVTKSAKPGAGFIFRCADATRITLDATVATFPPVVFDRCAKARKLNLVRFTDKGKLIILQAEAMEGYKRALKKCPSLEVAAAATSAYSGSFRTHAQQAWLYDQYKNHGGNLAAPECSSWHEAGLAVDILKPDEKDRHTHVTGREALAAEGFHDYLPEDPPHQTFRCATRTNKEYPAPKWANER